MFTGLVEAVGRVAEVQPGPAGLRLRIASEVAADAAAGDSLAVNGVCLTVVSAAEGVVDADVGPQTARLTTLGSLRAGSLVNLERPMPADGRFGGHFVLGHVDGTGSLTSIREEADARWLTVAFEDDLAAYLVPRGSVAMDGISLTIARLDHRTFDVMIVPFTWSHTNLRALRPGERVNLECDVIGKYVARALEVTRAATRTV